MKENTMKEKISKESAAEIAHHLSAVLNHPDTPSELYNDIVERVCDMANMSPLSDTSNDDKPEYLTKVLLAFGYNFESVKELYLEPTGNSIIPKSSMSVNPKFPRKDLRISFGKAFQEAKEHLDVIIDESEHEDYFLAALASLFGIIKEQDGIDKDDLLLNLQDYCFAHSRAFDAAAQAYRKHIGFKPTLTDESNETDNSESAD